MADTAVTLPKAQSVPLLNPEKTLGFTHKWVVTYDDVNNGTGSTDTETVTLGTTPANFCCTHAMAVVNTAFAGTTAFTMSVGFGSNTTAAIADTTVKTAGAICTAGAVVGSAANSRGTSAQAIKAVFTNATGGSPSALTAGRVTIYARILDLDRLP